MYHWPNFKARISIFVSIFSIFPISVMLNMLFWNGHNLRSPPMPTIHRSPISSDWLRFTFYISHLLQGTPGIFSKKIWKHMNHPKLKLFNTSNEDILWAHTLPCGGFPMSNSRLRIIYFEHSFESLITLKQPSSIKRGCQIHLSIITIKYVKTKARLKQNRIDKIFTQ